MAARPLRMYEPAWLKLKANNQYPKRIVIAAPAVFHRRIYKAVIKEKDMDVVYKYSLAENCQKAELSKESKGGQLTIFLHLSLGLDDF